MAYKVNYGLERAERNRIKQAKKEAKLRDRKASTANTDTVQETEPPNSAGAPEDEPESP